MKNTILFLCLICILATIDGCKKKDDKRGYKCENSQCKLVDEGADYLTLDECKSECAAPATVSKGRIEFKSGFLIYNQTNYTITVGVAKSAEDYSNNILLDEKKDSGSFTASGPDNQSKDVQFQHTTPEFTQASYYYVFTVVIDDPNSLPSVKQKNGAVSVTGGQTASVVHNP